MDWRVRALTALFMTAVMVAMVTLIITWLDRAVRSRAFRINGAGIHHVAIAAVTGYFVMPGARGLAERLVREK